MSPTVSEVQYRDVRVLCDGFAVVETLKKFLGYSHKKCIEWLATPWGAFEGESAFSLILAGRSEEVFQLLRKVEAGVYL